jgi:ABC-2 type transport system permease protein
VLRALRAEFLKLNRSKAVWGTVAIVAMFGLLTIVVTRFEDLSVRHATWSETLVLGPQFMAGWWGLVVFGMAAAALFGSEFGDGTAANMLTTPIRREYFVVAKMIVLALWTAALAFVAVASQMAAAASLGADGFAWDIVVQRTGDSLLVAVMIYMTLPIVALISMVGRGYLAPMLYSSALTALSLAATFLGWERWLPWAMQLTVAGGIAPPGILDTTLPPASWVILVAMFVAGLAAVFVYIDRAEDLR